MSIKITALYEMLSRDDKIQGESNSIKNRKEYLEDFARKNFHYTTLYDKERILLTAALPCFIIKTLYRLKVLKH